jgi:predicted Zn-dependent protease
MIDPVKARQLLDRVLAMARQTKGAEAIASLVDERAGNTRFAQNEITSSGDVERHTLSVTIQLGHRAASATANQLDDRALGELVARAVRMAQLAPENPETMPPLGRQTYVVTKPAIDPATAAMTPQARARAAGAAIAAGDAAKVAIAGFAQHATLAVAHASTAGLWAFRTATSCELSCTARTPDGTGSGWAGTTSHRVADLDAEALAKVAVDKATHSQRPARLEPGRYTVILEPAAVSALLEFLIGAFGARRADEGRSFFGRSGTKIGDRLFGPAITLRSDPGDPATGGTPFDGEGFPLRAASWIAKGMLTGLTYTRFWASKQGKPATGAPNGWTLEGGATSRDELLKGVDRGVLITRFWYLEDVDPQALLATGLTRDGTFLIERGELVGPVNNFRFNESPVQMLARCDALGATAIPAGEGAGVRVPILRTHEFNLASISEAV